MSWNFASFFLAILVTFLLMTFKATTAIALGGGAMIAALVVTLVSTKNGDE